MVASVAAGQCTAAAVSEQSDHSSFAQEEQFAVGNHLNFVYQSSEAAEVEVQTRFDFVGRTMDAREEGEAEGHRNLD